MDDKKLIRTAEELLRRRLLSPPWDSTRFVYVGQDETETFAPDNSFTVRSEPESATFSITDGPTYE